LSVTELGETEQLAPLGVEPWNAQASATVPLNPVGASCRLKVAVPPAATVAEVVSPVCATTAKSVPLPERVALYGLAGALLTMVILPVLAPLTVGVKVTLMPQLSPGSTATTLARIVTSGTPFVRLRAPHDESPGRIVFRG
jgi:hypothetical protein